VKHLLHLGYDLALRVADFDIENGLEVLLRLEGGADFLELRLGKTETGVTVPFAGGRNRMQADLSQTMYSRPKVFNQHQHVERISHGVERSAIMRANLICIPPAQPHFHFDRAPISVEALYPDACPKQRRIEIQHGSHMSP
jgi:hypothetical protein